MNPPAAPTPRPVPLALVRYALPATLIIAGFAILFLAPSSTRWDGWAMSVGGGLAVLLLNVLIRIGTNGDRDRDAEEAARDYLTTHGHWPDEQSTTAPTVPARTAQPAATRLEHGHEPTGSPRRRAKRPPPPQPTANAPAPDRAGLKHAHNGIGDRWAGTEDER